jgi:hypothetical protein
MTRPLRSLSPIACLFVVFTTACGPAPESDRDLDLVEVELALALDFESGDVLTIAVFDESLRDCAALLASGAGDTEPVAREVASAVAINNGEDVSFEFETLPAEIPLAFFGTATRGSTLLADDCTSATIPNGGSVEIVLALVEQP